ncbi:MAG: 16S rRNA (uracil(1498)-N(3))-methyltransferase [Nitrosomonadaceae bacterium]|nr:16S rRNA (uracil(1498)-N(3))-methyltransferase [Nitrosomonadaceae bacterium]
MKSPRFYYPDQINVGESIELSYGATHHAANVLRLEKGDRVTLFNGKGGEFLAFIRRISKAAILVSIEKFINVEHESPLQITLAQSICTNIKMDLIIRKAVELGVNNIQPILAKRCLVKLSGKRELKRVKHWEQIIISACEQCGRNRVPGVSSPVTLSSWLSRQGAMQKELNNEPTEKLYFMLSPTSKMGLHDFSKSLSVTELALLVGPEGGFTSDEDAAALMAGFSSLRLGSRTLRTESAALAAIAALQTIWGDY